MEEELKPVQVSEDTLTKEELLRLLDDSRQAYNNLDTYNASLQDSLTNSYKQYTEDTRYLNELKNNIINYYKTKERLVTTMLHSLIELTSLDSLTITPERKEDNDDTIR